MTEHESDVVVADAAELERFEARVDGELAGFAAYVRRHGRVIFTHTEVDDVYGGRGVGSSLARRSLEALRSTGEKVVPLCPFIAAFVDRRPEYLDLVDTEELNRLRMRQQRRSSSGAWPSLPWREWGDTLETVHLMAQVVGKVRLVQSPWLNHSWSVPLYVSPRGLRTSLVPYGSGGFELAFDLLDHVLRLDTTEGRRDQVALGPTSMSTFHQQVMAMLDRAGMPVSIHTTPSELADAVPFDQDDVERAYEASQVEAMWRALLRADAVMKRFRAGFLGKASPVHLFWGSFDLATTRFSGRRAPAHPGGLPNFPDEVAREAYSHEVSSCGLWFGDRTAPEPVFYAYAYPTPAGFSDAPVEPSGARWLEALGEFVLPYDGLLAADDSDEALLAFFESTHAAAADLGGWDRAELECAHPMGPDWWMQRIGGS